MGDGLTRQEQRLIERALEKAAGNQTSAARMLGVSRDRLRYRMKKYGLLDSNSSAASPVATLA
ncbi:MAG: helix-turn-helix domain-containing protein [Acidobacteriota bacterium]